MNRSDGIEHWLDQRFEELSPLEFYRLMFPDGELASWVDGSYDTWSAADKKVNKGMYTAIVVCISQTELREHVPVDAHPQPKIYRYSVTDDLDQIDELTHRRDLFCLMSPISYAGKKRSAANARFFYGVAIDLDCIRMDHDGNPVGLSNLWDGHVLQAKRLPRPTSIVFSGTGVHLYYLFDKPIPAFSNVVMQLQALKRELTELVWHDSIVDIQNVKEIQYEGVFQGFRVVGTPTKNGKKARAFSTGDKVSIDYLNEFVHAKNRVTQLSYKRDLPLKKAASLYPDWYEERVVLGKKGVLHPWAVNRRFYDWWIRECKYKARVGHRYYCLMCLAIIAEKCSIYDAKKNPNPVTREELEKDAFELADYFETLTISEDNHFGKEDVLDALEAFSPDFLTYPRDSIEYKAGFELPPPTERNKRKQAIHLMGARAIQEINDKANGTNWRTGNGRKPKYDIVAKWREENPSGTKIQCERETGLSRHTVLKWWNYNKNN